MKDMKIPQLDSGDKLYHYTSAEGVIGISDGEFWVTERSFLNDTTEFKIAGKVFEELLNKKTNDSLLCEKLKKILRKEMDKIISESDKQSMNKGYYVISFCLEKDSMLMWSQYSDFIGYCLEFDYEKLVNSFNPSGTLILHGKVIYDNKEQEACIERVLEEFIFENMDDYPEINDWNDLIKLVQKDTYNLIPFISVILSIYNMFFKKAHFKDEKEYRTIFSCIHTERCGTMKLVEEQYFRVKNEVLIPFVKKNYNKDSLLAILVGPKNNCDIAQKGLEYFYKNKGMDIRISKSKIPLRF